MKHTLHFLIAEDDTDIAFLVKLFVKRLFPHATITIVNNGKDVLMEHQAHSADIILLDHQMPITTGVEAIRTLRSKGDSVPIILVTANSGVNYHFAADTQTRFLLKPLDLDVLSQTIEHMLPIKEKAVSAY